MPTRLSIVVLASLTSVLTWQTRPGMAQSQNIWDGAFTAAQVERGHQRFTNVCRRCHNDDLNGSERGPALRGAKFLSDWETQDLGRLFAKIKDSMPPDSPSSLPDEEYVDVLTYILQANSFPAGKEPLTTARLESFAIVGKTPGASRDLPNFRLVQVVGCLTPGADNTWSLTHTTAPVVSTDQPSTPASLKDAAAQPLGSQAFRLIGVNSFTPEAHKGQKMQARGLLYRAPNKDRINVVSLEVVDSNCLN